MEIPDFDTPEGMAEYMKSQLILSHARSLQYDRGNSPLVRMSRIYHDLFSASKVINEEHLSVVNAKRFLHHTIPKYRDTVPADVRKILDLDEDGLERKCKEALIPSDRD